MKMWKCPKCGCVLIKGNPMLEAAAKSGGTVAGTATCTLCFAQWNQYDVYTGKYDLSQEEETVCRLYKKDYVAALRAKQDMKRFMAEKLKEMKTKEENAFNEVFDLVREELGAKETKSAGARETPMSILVTCPTCGKSCTASDDAIGKGVRCEACHELFTVTAPQLALSDPPGTGQSGRPLAKTSKTLVAKLRDGDGAVACHVCGGNVDVAAVKRLGRRSQVFSAGFRPEVGRLFQPGWSEGAACTRCNLLLCGSCVEKRQQEAALSQSGAPVCPECKDSLIRIDSLPDWEELTPPDRIGSNPPRRVERNEQPRVDARGKRSRMLGWLKWFRKPALDASCWWQLIGKHLEHEEVRELLERLRAHCTPKVEGDKSRRTYLFRQICVLLTFSDDALERINLSSWVDDVGSLHRFPGTLPGSLTFADTANEVWEKLGTATSGYEAPGFWVQQQFRAHHIWVRYNRHTGKVDSITFGHDE